VERREIMLKCKRADPKFVRPLVCIDRAQSAFRIYDVVLGVMCLVSSMSVLASLVLPIPTTTGNNNTTLVYGTDYTANRAMISLLCGVM
jgi:hypothetical protein